MRYLRLLSALLVLSGCGDDVSSVDAGPGPVDGGDVDGGTGDAAAADAAGDTGSDDAGVDAEDAGDPECMADEADVYASVPVAGAPDGTVLACAAKGAALVAGVQARIGQTGLTATSGYSSSLLAYQTHRDEEREGVGTAVLFMPDTPRPGTPIIAVAHGTVGHSDMCAPSRRDPDAGLALPWVGLGFTTITVDYTGLGTDGVQGYGNAYDTAQSLLDGARAAIQHTGDARPIVLVGHSQGGRAVHFAQGLAPAYAPDLEVSHAIAFAGSPTAPEMLSPAAARLIGRLRLSVNSRAFFAMSVYADFANAFGVERASEPFAPELREVITNAMENDCIVSMIGSLAVASGTYEPPTTVGALLSQEILDALPLCAGGDPGCTEEAARLLTERFERSYIPPARDGAPVLMVAAADDTIHAPGDHACAYDEQVASGVTLSRCFLSGENHFTVVEAGIASAVAWVMGGGLECPAEDPAPSCR